MTLEFTMSPQKPPLRYESAVIHVSQEIIRETRMVYFASDPENSWPIHVSPSAISRRNGQSLDAMELLPYVLHAININIHYVFC